MSTTVTYKGSTLTTVSNDTATLETSGTWLEDDITLTDVTSSATLGTKTITANGTYNASSDSLDGYSQVTASVPNTYAAGDEGKVVSSGALVSQTAHADVTPTTSDQTIDTTTNNSLKVKGDADLVAGNIKKDVEIFGVTGSYEGGSGGSSPITLLDTITVSSDTRALSIDLTPYANYNVLFISEDSELSTSDWLYYRDGGDPSSPSGGGYSDGAKKTHQGICLWKFLVSGSTTIRFATIAHTGYSTSGTGWTSFLIYAYSATNTIKAGSTYKIYGGTYADL